MSDFRCTSETSASEPTDLVGNKRANFLLWRLPWIAVIASSFLKDSSLKAGIWTTAFAQMGTACVANASGCGRLHCYFTGPFYLLGAVASYLRGTGRLPIPWPALAGAIALGTCALYWLPERLWGKYATRAFRVTGSFDRFTDRARRVLERAQQEAQEFRHNYIGTEHLLLGLIHEEQGIAAKLLREGGVDLERTRSAIVQIIGHGDRSCGEDIGLTPRSKRVIEFALDEARRLKHDYIGTEHLLLGLLREGEGVAVGVLKSLRGPTDLPKVRQQITRLLSQEQA